MVDAESILAAHEAAKQRRAEAMPTEQDAIRAMYAAWTRLKELGWRDGRYMPTDGERFAGIQSGSTGIHAFTADRREGLEPPMYFIHDGDLWCSYTPPVLFRPWREDDVQPNLRICAPIPDAASKATGDPQP
jgi:hypothetical protein